MEACPLHPWDLSPAQAIGLQKELAQQVVLEDQWAEIDTVAGVDCGFEENGAITRAAIAVLDFHSLQVRERALAKTPTRFPYVPGLLSFREIPAILLALQKLATPPDLLIVDGQGYAHPRRLGIASHLGLLTGIPSIGVGKTRLLGNYQEPANHKGAWSPLLDAGEMIGAVLRTRANTKPLFVSSGHKISLSSAIGFVLACTPRYRLPETTRQAHKLASLEKDPPAA